jgi:hypothetical protein
MDEQEVRALEDPEEWDSEQAEVRPPSKSARAVVSVAFPRDDFDRVSDAARSEGMKTSEFIREAALARAAHQQRRSRIYASGFRGAGEDVTIAWRSPAVLTVTIHEPATQRGDDSTSR